MCNWCCFFCCCCRPKTKVSQITPEKLMPYYMEADLIIHDCLLDGSPGFVHATIMQLLELPAEIKAKILLHHYDARKFEHLSLEIQDRITHEFKGFTSPGLDLKNLPEGFLNPFDEMVSCSAAPKSLAPSFGR